MASDKANPVANPMTVLREEFDDWAILFDPDSGNAYGLNPMGVFIWKHLDGKHSLKDILQRIHENCENVPEDVENHLKAFTQDLVERGFVGYETQEVSKE